MTTGQAKEKQVILCATFTHQQNSPRVTPSRLTGSYGAEAEGSDCGPAQQAEEARGEAQRGRERQCTQGEKDRAGVNVALVSFVDANAVNGRFGSSQTMGDLSAGGTRR